MVVDPDVAWSRAVELGGRGRYAAAEALLRVLRTGPAVPARLRAHAAVTRASHLRQVGGHGRAQGFDASAACLARGLASSPVPDVDGYGAAAALGDALAGLAADAIGRADAATAERMLHRAAPWCGVPDGGTPPVSRTAVRWMWVRAETSLLGGDPDAAVRAAGTALALAGGLGSPRHVWKSRLVHAVARAVAGSPVPGELDAVAAGTRSAGLLPLEWAALTAADALEGPGAAEGPGPVPVDRPPIGRHAGTSSPDTLGRQTVALSRRHAAMLAMNAIYLRCDPEARREIRE